MNEKVKALRLRQLLYMLVVVLTFEGVVRKASPQSLSIPLFLIKDILVTIMTLYVVQMPSNPAISFLWSAYRTLLLLFVPLIFLTAWHDPLLAIFGIKQYLLYPMVGFATFHAFQNVPLEVALTFFRRISLLVFPTAMLAYVELKLPHDHWLNLSVVGDTLEAFMAAGELRVSSTFSFCAQYCAFLNAQIFFIMIALQGWRERNIIWKLLLVMLIPVLVYSCYITGSRGAVAGNTGIIIIAGIFAMMKFQVRSFLQIIIVIATLYLASIGVNYFSPDATAAYSARQNGQLIGITSDLWERIFGVFFSNSRHTLSTSAFGYGLGVMSNGSDTFSNYAAIWRMRLWTESDFATTAFEGGYYLILVWYGFRFFVIYVTTRRYLREVTGSFTVPIAFVQSFVMIVGAVGTLSIQPPIAIWWWMGVGTSVLFSWKASAPPESETDFEEPPPPPRKTGRGRSRYADVLHSRK